MNFSREQIAALRLLAERADGLVPTCLVDRAIQLADVLDAQLDDHELYLAHKPTDSEIDQMAAFFAA